MSTAPGTTTRSRTAPGIYWIWLAGLGWTSIGANLLAFGMVWSAAAHSAWLAGIVLLCTALPQVLLALFGGVIADRLGPIRVMIAADAMMASFTAVAAVVAVRVGDHPVLLIGVAAVLGTAQAFYLPSAGSVPKLLVPEGGLPRAMAGRQLVVYFASVAGPVLGGVAVSTAGLPLSLALGAAGFAGMLLILLVLRRRVSYRAAEPAETPIPPAVLVQMTQGLHLTWRSPLLRAVVMMTAAFALFALPVAPMLVPVLAGERGWDAALAGTASGAFAAGMAVLALVVMWRGGAQRAGATAVAGMLLAGIGIIGLGMATTEPLALAAVLAAGLGAGLFSTHVGPLFVAAAPQAYIARVQSVMMIAQSAPMMLAGPVIGVLADRVPVDVVVIVWGAGAAGVALATLSSSTLRAARRPG